MTDIKDVTITRHLPVPLTPSEKIEKHELLVRTLNDKERLEENFSLLREQHKANVKSRDVSIRELSHDLHAGYIMRPIACRQVVQIERNAMVTYRLDTEEKVDERALTADEIKHYRSTKTSVKP